MEYNSLSQWIGRQLNQTMLHTLTLLTVMRLLSQAQLNCRQSQGFISYERIPNHRLAGFPEKTLRDVLDPAEMVEKCMDFCRDLNSNNSVSCGFFNLQSGKSRSRLNFGPAERHRWHESQCHFAVLGQADSSEKTEPEVKLQADEKFDHFAQICLSPATGRLIQSRCPNKVYVFNRVPKLKFIQDWELGNSVISVFDVKSRQDCQDLCLAQTQFPCRSASFQLSTSQCYLNEVTQESQPWRAQPDQDFDYLENVCLSGETRCSSGSSLHFVHQDKEELLNTKDTMALPVGTSRELCRRICRDDSSLLPFFCKSFHYQPALQLCLLSENDGHLKKAKLVNSTSFSYYESTCIGHHSRKKATSQSSSHISTSALARSDDEETTRELRLLRNSWLEAEPYRVYQGYELGRCLDQCLYPITHSCKSVGYNEESGECRLSSFDEREARLTYHPAFNYYHVVTDRSNEDKEGNRYYYQHYPGAYQPSSSGGFSFPPPPSDHTLGSSRTTTEKAIVTEDRSLGSGSSLCPDGIDDASPVFGQLRSRTRLRSDYIERSLIVASLYECERVCLEERQFQCMSFNFMPQFHASLPANCHLSSRSHFPPLDLNDPNVFEVDEDYDFYALLGRRDNPPNPCIDVSQECTAQEMIFTLRTQRPFRGRIYTYKHFDRSPCFVQGSGGLTHRLRIPRADSSLPNCGTESIGGNTQTNIVVVQKSQMVQTSKDMIYNLTCTLQSPGQSVVSSGYIGAGSGEPIQIEYLPAEHTLDSRVQLVIEYKGRPTTTIAVGDELTFKLETQEGANLVRDIFATNVIAKDPYTQRTIELIDAYGCPVDPSVFPALGLSRSGEGIETVFQAFKIPESNFLVFEATIVSCHRGQCQPALCQGPEGRSLNSFGRRRRRRRRSETFRQGRELNEDISLREMFRVYETREEIPATLTSRRNKIGGTSSPKFCLNSTEYYGLVTTFLILVFMVLFVTMVAGLCYRKVRQFSNKIYDNSAIVFPSAIRARPSVPVLPPDGNNRRRTPFSSNPLNSGKRAFYLPEPSSNETLDVHPMRFRLDQIDTCEPLRMPDSDNAMFENTRSSGKAFGK